MARLTHQRNIHFHCYSDSELMNWVIHNENTLNCFVSKGNLTKIFIFNQQNYFVISKYSKFMRVQLKYNRLKGIWTHFKETDFFPAKWNISRQIFIVPSLESDDGVVPCIPLRCSLFYKRMIFSKNVPTLEKIIKHFVRIEYLSCPRAYTRKYKMLSDWVKSFSQSY